MGSISSPHGPQNIRTNQPASSSVSATSSAPPSHGSMDEALQKALQARAPKTLTQKRQELADVRSHLNSVDCGQIPLSVKGDAPFTSQERTIIVNKQSISKALDVCSQHKICTVKKENVKQNDLLSTHNLNLYTSVAQSYMAIRNLCELEIAKGNNPQDLLQLRDGLKSIASSLFQEMKDSIFPDLGAADVLRDFFMKNHGQMAAPPPAPPAPPLKDVLARENTISSSLPRPSISDGDEASLVSLDDQTQAEQPIKNPPHAHKSQDPSQQIDDDSSD